jgi:hypothetical protein
MENHSGLLRPGRRQSTYRNQPLAGRPTVPGPTDIRDVIVALEARRVELEILIADDLERRFFSKNEEIAEVVTNMAEADGAFAEFRVAKTGCRSHFTMTWFAVSTS